MLFSQLYSKCQGKTRKDGARLALFLIFVLFYVFFVFFYVFLCCSMYCLFCVVLCIVCVYMCTVLLPPGGYSIAVKYIISYRIKREVILDIFNRYMAVVKGKYKKLPLSTSRRRVGRVEL
jgi:hypothetical protein